MVLRPIIIAGGGTGGHVYPGLALAEELRALQPERPVRWVGTRDRMEAHAVPSAGLPIDFVDVAFLKGRRGKALAGAALKLPKAGAQALRLIRKHRPAAVVGVGGFASAPMGVAAKSTRTPLFILEQNARPGLTNKLLSRVARRAFTSFASTSDEFSCPSELTGNPIRQSLLATVAAERAPGPPRLLVLGGSQGARSLNEGLPSVIAALRYAGVAVEVKHSSGSGADASVLERYGKADVVASVFPFINDMAEAYRWADLVVTRAGATTIAELTALGIPAMYVPFPHAADDHQTSNARTIVEAGGGVMVSDAELLDGGRPARILTPLLGHLNVLRRMGDAAAAMGRPHAGRVIAERILSEIGDGGVR
jgi:UDP-N-acetylglucosamine--N-acetylmuramyl-(pentapeptide) pyrophosphoryl-undecaprenol N-acetylglucosamine transferase